MNLPFRSLVLACLVSASLLGCATTGGNVNAPPPRAADADAPYLTDADVQAMGEGLWATQEVASLVTTLAEREQVLSCMASAVRAAVPTKERASDLGDETLEAIGMKAGIDCMVSFKRKVLMSKTFSPSFVPVYTVECSLGSPDTPEACECLAENAAAHFPSPRAFLEVETALEEELELSEEQASRLSGLSATCQLAASAE